MRFDIIFIPTSRPQFIFGAALWTLFSGSGTICTMTMTDDQLLELVKGKSILIVDAFLYEQSIARLLAEAKNVMIFFPEDNGNIVVDGYEYHNAKEGEGFATWSIKQTGCKDENLIKKASYIDDVIYGFPSDDAIYYISGMHDIRMGDGAEIITNEIPLVIAKGKIARTMNITIAQRRLFGSKFMIYKTKSGHTISALVAIGDCAILDTLLLLVEKSLSEIAILFDYSIATNETFIYLRVSKKSQLNADVLIKDWLGGHGTRALGKAVINRLIFPEDPHWNDRLE